MCKKGIIRRNSQERNNYINNLFEKALLCLIFTGDFVWDRYRNYSKVQS